MYVQSCHAPGFVPSLLSCFGGLVEHQPCRLDIAGLNLAQGSSTFSSKLAAWLPRFDLLCLNCMCMQIKYYCTCHRYKWHFFNLGYLWVFCFLWQCDSTFVYTCMYMYIVNYTVVAYLSLDMLQSMVVFLLVLTTKKGRLMAEFWDGAPKFATRSRFLFIRFLKDRIYDKELACVC